MTDQKRSRLNLSINGELHSFIKKYSKVTKTPISHCFEDYIKHLLLNISRYNPETYFDEIIEKDYRNLEETGMQLNGEKEVMTAKLEFLLAEHPDALSNDQKNEILKMFKTGKSMTPRDRRKEKFVQRWKDNFNKEKIDELNNKYNYDK